MFSGVSMAPPIEVFQLGRDFQVNCQPIAIQWWKNEMLKSFKTYFEEKGNGLQKNSLLDFIIISFKIEKD